MIWLVNSPTDETSRSQYIDLVKRTTAMKLPEDVAREILQQLSGRAVSTPSLSHFAVEAWAWFLQNPLTVTVDSLTTSWHACFSLRDIVNCEYTLNVSLFLTSHL